MVCLGECHKLQRNLYKALAYFTQAVKLKPNLRGKIGTKRAACYLKIGELDKAEEDLTSVFHPQESNIGSQSEP